MKKITDIENRIIKAFIKLLNTTDYSRVSVTSITKEAKVNRTSFYMYWDNVKDLARYLCVEYFIDQFDELMGDDLTQMSHRDSIRRSYEFMDKNRDGILGLWKIKGEDFQPYLIMQRSYYKMMMRKMIGNRDISREEMKKTDLFCHMVSACTMATMEYFLYNEDQTVEKTVNEIMTAIHNGMVTLLD